MRTFLVFSLILSLISVALLVWYLLPQELSHDNLYYLNPPHKNIQYIHKELGLFQAIHKHDIQAIKDLIKEGVDVTIHAEFYGDTPLIVAAKEGSYQMIELLIKAGACVNERNNSLATALMYAVANCDDVYKVTTLLLHAGADYTLQDDTAFCGHDAYYYARERDWQIAQTSDNGPYETISPDLYKRCTAFQRAVDNYTQQHGLPAFISPFKDNDMPVFWNPNVQCRLDS